MIISIIAAMDKNRVIGKDNALPWKHKDDMKRFVQLTTGKPVIMGRKTFESIGKPLRNRTNLILTRDKNYSKEGCIIVHNVDEALNKCGDAPEAMVIGGAEIYKQFLPKTTKMYITLIDGEFEGDTYFPKYDENEWNTVENKTGNKITILTLVRKKS